MQYEEARGLIKSGDLLAWSHRKSMFASWYDFKVGLVRLFRRSEYCHVGLAWLIGGRMFVLEAVVPSVRIYPLSKCGEFYWLNTNPNWTPIVEEEAISKVGLGYSTTDAIMASFVEIEPESVSECAAYVIHIMKAAGINLGKKATPDAVVREAQMLRGVKTVFIG